MTTAENVGKAYMLSEVEQQIRKDIPRLMELREGLVFHFKDRVLKVLYKYDETRWKCVDTFGVQGKFPDEVINKESKIIGNDIMVNDVLEWFDKKADNPDDRYFQDLGYTTNNGFLECWREDKILFKWNLQTPYLKDQPEELIKFLYDLMKD